MRYQSSASSVRIKAQKMASKAINPPALDPKIVESAWYVHGEISKNYHRSAFH